MDYGVNNSDLICILWHCTRRVKLRPRGIHVSLSLTL